MVIRIPDQRTTRGGYAALDDRMLVLDFQAGDLEAFVEIHHRYGGLARHVCQRFLPNPADTDEALQETMIRVFQGLYRFNGRYALRPWIARIAKNVSLDILRGRSRRPLEDGEDPVLLETRADPRDEADLIVERLVARDTVLAVLADLPETHRRALVMREIDGASHREIARELEISPPQAKALLHRARGSFRKRWLEKVTGEGGLRAIVLLPLLWCASAFGALRRLFDRAGQAVGHASQAAQAAAPEAVTSAVSTAAPASAGIAERVIAAGVTILVASGVTVGAARIVQHRSAPAPEEIAAAAAALAAVPAPEAASTSPETSVTPERRDPLPLPQERVDPVLVDPSPTQAPNPSPAPAPSEQPSPTTAPSPSVEPSPSQVPPPPPPQPPAYVFDFAAPGISSLCPCLMIATVTGSSVSGSHGAYDVRQSIDGRAVADGQDAYDLWLEYDASVSAGSGALSADFYVEIPDGGWYAYRGTATLVSAVATEHGTDYTLQGAFNQQNPSDSATDEVPTSGAMTVTLRVWDDGKLVLYGAEFRLST